MGTFGPRLSLVSHIGRVNRNLGKWQTTPGQSNRTSLARLSDLAQAPKTDSLVLATVAVVPPIPYEN